MLGGKVNELIDTVGSAVLMSESEGESGPIGKRAGEGNAEDVFSNEAAVDLYTDRVKTDGLFEQEEKAVERFFTKSGGTVLDVGCGVGRVSHRLDERGFEVTGIDVSEPLVERARSLFPEIEFRVENVTDTDFPSESFDYAVFSFYGLDYVLPKRQRIEALKEIYRVLKPGGFLVFSTHNSWYLLPDLLFGDRSYVKDLLLTPKNVTRLFRRYKFESVPLGELEIYLSSPLHQWTQLRKCGFTPMSLVGRRDNVLKLFEYDTHYVAKK